MGKFAKVCLIIAGVFIGIGVVMGTIVSVIGGRSFVWVVNEQNMNFGEYHGDWGWDLVSWDSSRNELVVNDQSLGSKSAEARINAKGVDTLYITVGAGEFELREWDQEEFKVEISGRGECEYYTNDGNLYIKGFKKLKKFTGYAVNNKITLYVPEGVNYDDVNLEVGAGKSGISGIQTKNLTCSVGMGAADFKNIDAEDVDMEVGMGQITFAGKAEGDVTVSCGMGSIAMKLDSSEEDYNYVLSCAAGSISLDNQSFSMLAGEKNINNSAAYDINLECAMGSIDVDFMR